MRNLLMFIVVMLAIGAVVMHFGTPQSLDQPAKAAVEPPPVALKSFVGTKDGNILLGTFAIENQGGVDVKDIVISCTHHGPSGTAIDQSVRIIYQIVKAHSVKTVRDFNMGFVHPQAVSSSCEVGGFSRS
jgi:hypothetical protein